MTVEFSSELSAEFLAAAQEAAPQECCGILLGAGDCITGIIPTRNVHSKPETHFEIDPSALIAAYRAEREGGPDVIGFYHSHPSGLAIPSQTDAYSAAHDGKIWGIIAGGRTRFWRDEPNGFIALSYCVRDA